MLTWELLGALLGAGFASGREIAAFFARYEAWGYAGAVAAAVVLVWLADTKLPSNWLNKWPERLWKMLLIALLTATGGAMLSGAGEVAAVALPFRGAYWWGCGITLLLSWFLACKTRSGLAWVSRMMAFVFIGMLLIGLTIPSEAAVAMDRSSATAALAKGLCYGGFNAALLIPILNNAVYPVHIKRRALCRAGLLVLLLLFAGIAALQRHRQLLHEPLPFVQMLHGWGKPGYYLSAACLYLAILSTLTACIRGMGKSVAAFAGIIGVSFLGFERVVEDAYAILGGACMMMLLAAKFRNCSRKAFISGEDML